MKIVEKLTFAKTTKTTHVYEGTKIPALYVPKLNFPDPNKAPKELVVTLEGADE